MLKSDRLTHATALFSHLGDSMTTSFALLGRIPADTIEAPVLQKLQVFARAHDSLMVVDPQGGAPAVQLQSLQGFLGEFFPASFATAALARFQQEDASFLTAQQSWPRVDWAGLAGHGAPIAPPTDAELDAADLGHHPDQGQIEQWLTQQHGSLLQSASSLTPERISVLVNQVSSSAPSESAATDEASVGDFWNCLVRHLGIWGALAVFSALGAALIILTGTGPIGIPLIIWLIATFGGGTAVIILNCALSPFS